MGTKGVQWCVFLAMAEVLHIQSFPNYEGWQVLSPGSLSHSGGARRSETHSGNPLEKPLTDESVMAQLPGKPRTFVELEFLRLEIGINI